jgi:hypothetical protein
MQYIEKNREELQDDDISKLLACVRLTLLTAPALVSLYAKFPKNLSADFQDALVRRLCISQNIRVPLSINRAHARGVALNGDRPRVQIAPDLNFKGVFYWIGTHGHETAWTNPFVNGNLAITTSGVWNGLAPHPSIAGNAHDPESIVDVTWMNNQIGEWVCFDIDPREDGIRLNPTHYYYHYSAQYWQPTNWVFEARTDATEPWIVIRIHNQDNSILQAAPRHGVLFDLPSVSPENQYRFFRLRNTGPDANGSYWLGISFLEIFGALFHK